MVILLRFAIYPQRLAIFNEAAIGRCTGKLAKSLLDAKFACH